MKKIVAFILMLFLSATVSAESQFKNAGALFQYWAGSDAYPDYVCGVWSTDGGHINLTISVLNTEEGNNGKQEILDLIENDATVIFEYGEYSYNYLRSVQRELEQYMGLETGFISSGVDVKSSRLNIGFLAEKLETPETVVMLEELKEKYGDVFNVHTSEPVHLLTTEEKPLIYKYDAKQSADYTVFVIVCALLLFLLTAAVLRRRVAVTTTGDTTTSSPPTKRQVEKMIVESVVEYPTDLDQRIKDKLKRE